MVAAKHTFGYLAGTTDFSITYKRGGFNLEVFSNSHLANNPDNRTSTSCYLSMLCDAPFCFKLGLQGLTVNHGGGAGRVGIGDKGSSVLPKRAD